MAAVPGIGGFAPPPPYFAFPPLPPPPPEDDPPPPTALERTVQYLSQPLGRFLLCTLLLGVAALGYPFVGVAVLAHLDCAPYALVVRAHKERLLLTALAGFGVVFAAFCGGCALALLQWRGTGFGRESTDVLCAAVPFTLAVGFAAPLLGFVVRPGELPWRAGFMVEHMVVASAVGLAVVVGGSFVLLGFGSWLFSRLCS